MQYPDIKLDSLDNLWFQVSGTLCNLACNHCFISCSPYNHTFEFMDLETVDKYLKESVEMGVKEYYFTGGETFANKQIIPILERTLQFGPATVLTNGTLIRRHTPQKLAELSENSIYSLDIRVSVDGYTPEMNDAIRGEGVFKRAMEGVRKLVAVGFLPIITVVQTWEEFETDQILQNFTETLKSYGYSRPRIKIIPSLRIGREALRTTGYENSEYVTEEMLEGYDVSQLICSNSRMVTDRGVYVCPILIEEDDARMGKSLKDSAGSYHLKHQACFTCYLFGAICSNFTSVSRDA